ncbi:glycosyltransferase, partial [Corynebacterium marambiense]
MTEQRLRIAVVAESFLPNVNGVSNSVLRILEHLADHGHEALVIAPGARDFEEEVVSYAGFPVVRVPTVMVPLINSLPVGVPVPLVRTLRDFRPDVVHLASPYVLGAAGASAARRLGVPALAVYQTDVAGFALRYHLRLLISASWRVTRMIHNSCACTLAPSTAAIAELTGHGVRNVHRWARGVDTVRFNPAHRSVEL